MKTLVTILIGVSLAFTAAFAQQDETQSTPAPKKQQRHKQQEERQQGRQGPPERRAQEQRPSRQETRMQHGNQPAAPAHQQGQRARAEQRNNNRSQTSEEGPNANAGVNQNARTGAQRHTNAGAQTATAQTTQRNAKARPDAQTVQRIKQQHTNFHAQARPQKVPSVSFQENYRISNAQQWQGPQYEAFRTYRPARHDRGWWTSHYHHIVLIGGGYYYWNNGYWYPAWGYDPGASYYTYNGPIYTGSQNLPPDQVIANVQAELQQMGYYKGEVDGLLGPLTREALTQYQSDHGLYTTAAIDQPTLDSLGLAS